MQPNNRQSPIPDSASNVKVRVLYIDTDQSGVAYHGAYLRWLEAGRGNYMRRRGVPYLRVEQSGLLFPVIEAHVEYLRPAEYDDVLDVTAWISELGGAQIRFDYVISRGEQALIKGYTRHAAVGENGRPTRLPDAIKQALSGPEKTDIQAAVSLETPVL
jgi:acyl-CoA thioester hydrolase